MSGEITMGEEKKKDVSIKAKRGGVLMIILVIAAVGAILIGTGLENTSAANLTAVSKEPTTQDSKLQAEILKMQNESKKEEKNRIKDQYLAYPQKKEEGVAERLLRQLEKNAPPEVDKERKKPLYEVLNINEEEIKGKETKSEIEEPVKRTRRINRYIERDVAPRPQRRYGDDDIFATEIGGAKQQSVSNYAGLVDNELDQKLDKFSGMMKEYMGKRDYSERMDKGGEIEVVYNENPQVVVYEGDFLECVLQNKIKSDIAESPAIVEVARDFFDRSNRYVVIPKGTRVIGYSRPVMYKGAARLYIFFRRMILPNGVSLNLQDKSIALDKYGINGVSSGVNRHFLLKYGSAFMVGLLDGLGGLTQNRLRQNSSVSYMIDEMYRNVNGTNREILREYQDVVPTIKVNPGTKVLVYMSADIRISAYSKIGEMSYAEGNHYE